MTKPERPTSDAPLTTEKVGEHFSVNWYDEGSGVFSDQLYEDLMAKMDDRSYIPKAKPLLATHRAVIACDDILQNVIQGGRVLDMACGIGFVSHCLTSKGFDAEGFDISEKAIDRARAKAVSLNQDPEKYSVADHTILEKFEDETFDAVLAIGLFRYLSRTDQEYCYQQAHRILKPGGRLLVVHQNLLFEMFALNDGTLKFWSDVIEDFSDAESLLEGKSVNDALREKITVPTREYDQKLSSKTLLDAEAENPLTFSAVAERYGFSLGHISYANPHLLPPDIERELNQERLTRMKQDVCLAKADDWRSMFMDFEFLAFLEKT